MNDPLSPFKKMHSLRLSTEEKRRTRNHIVAYVHAHPLMPHGFISVLAQTMYRYSLAGLALFIALGAGALGVISQSTIPGDRMYSIKIRVTEPLGDALAVTEEQQISWDITKAERRMDEIEQLAIERGF